MQTARRNPIPTEFNLIRKQIPTANPISTDIKLLQLDTDGAIRGNLMLI